MRWVGAILLGLAVTPFLVIRLLWATARGLRAVARWAERQRQHAERELQKLRAKQADTMSREVPDDQPPNPL